MADKKSRKRIPPELEYQVLYKSARTCCVCRVRGNPVEIHHIDQNPSNNVETNLVAICKNCHSEAHTTRALSKNLTPQVIFDFKNRWEEEVVRESARSMLPSSNLSQAVWTYINHQRLPPVMKSLGVKFDKSQLQMLRSSGTVDASGFPIFKRGAKGVGLTTIYDRIEWDEAMRFHYMYAAAVDEIILKSNPIELGAIWTKKEIKALVHPGAMCFCLRGFRFKRGQEIDGEEDRLVYARASGIEVRMMANTRHMYGSSALYTHFSGNSFTAILFFVKNVSTQEKILVIDATPLAMGVGFVPSEYHTPRPLLYRWAK